MFCSCPVIGHIFVSYFNSFRLTRCNFPSRLFILQYCPISQAVPSDNKHELIQVAVTANVTLHKSGGSSGIPWRDPVVLRQEDSDEPDHVRLKRVPRPSALLPKLEFELVGIRPKQTRRRWPPHSNKPWPPCQVNQNAVVLWLKG